MSSFSIYIVVVATSVLFIFSSSSSSSRPATDEHRLIKLEYTKKKLEEERRYLEMKKLARAKVIQDLRMMDEKKRLKEIESIGENFDGSLSIIPGLSIPKATPVLKSTEILTEKELSMVEETEQASLTEAAETFNRKCLEIEALLKEK